MHIIVRSFSKNSRSFFKTLEVRDSNVVQFVASDRQKRQKKALEQKARNVCAPLSKGARPESLQFGRWFV
jgi:hypothetical protein